MLDRRKIIHNSLDNVGLGLVSKYKFEDNLTDDKGGHNGNTDNVGMTYESGVFGKALRFDGNDSYATIPHTVAHQITNSGFSVMCQFKMDVVENSWFVAKRVNSSAPEWQFYYFNNELVLSVFDNTTKASRYRFAKTLTVGTLYHICVTYDNTNNTFKMYVNGELADGFYDVDAGFTNAYNGTSNVMLGALRVSPNNINFSLDGTLDAINIYNKILTEREVKYIALNNLQGVDVVPI